MTDTQAQPDQIPAVDSLWRNTDGGLSTVTAVKQIAGDIYVQHTTDGPGADEWSISLTARHVFLTQHTPQAAK